MNIKKENGEILSISMIFIGITITIFMFLLAIFMSHVNSVLYNFKVDMYSLNRSAIISINKYETSIDDFSYNKEAYKNEFIKGLKKNYDLDENLENTSKLISKIEIIDYEIYEDNAKDTYTNKKCTGRVIHTVMKIKVKPIILKSVLENIFTFTIHEDVSLNSMNAE